MSRNALASYQLYGKQESRPKNEHNDNTTYQDLLAEVKFIQQRFNEQERKAAQFWQYQFKVQSDVKELREEISRLRVPAYDPEVNELCNRVKRLEENTQRSYLHYIDNYNDAENHVSAEQQQRITTFMDNWNQMLCSDFLQHGDCTDEKCNYIHYTTTKYELEKHLNIICQKKDIGTSSFFKTALDGHINVEFLKAELMLVIG